MDTLTYLKELSQHTGPSGRENAISEKVKSYWAPLVDDVWTDALGNVIAYKHGHGDHHPSIMLAAHMDEIGLIVTGMSGDFIRIHSIGGMDRRILIGTEVTVHGHRDIPGVIGSRPPHILEAQDRDKIPPWHELYIDVGLPEAEIKESIRVGDHVTIQQPLVALKNNRVAGKALDNRASVAAVTLALEFLKPIHHSWDVIAVATVQEELGLIGATTSAYGIAPDMAIAVDATFAKQYNDNDGGAFQMDKGPTIGVGPNLHPQVVKRLCQTAEKYEIPFMMEPLSGSSGTDAWAIQVACEGIPTGLLSIPIRYMHQPVETAVITDIERTARLLGTFITELEPDFAPAGEDSDD